MRAFWVLWLSPLISMAQSPGVFTGPPPVLTGVLLERDAQPGSGEFSVRAADNQVYRFQFDRKTFVEREDDLIDVPRLLPGEKVEVVSDNVPGVLLRYARTIHVVMPQPPHTVTNSRQRAARGATDRGAADRSLPTGNLTFSGVVFRLNSDRLTMHTREAGDQTILLRKDTRYLANGEIVEAGELRPNMRVFVRGGTNLYDQVEAYQVVWGKILEPSAR